MRKTMIRRSCAAFAAAGLLALGLSAVPQAQALATGQTGPFPVGNLLSYANADFEGSVGDWATSDSTANSQITDDTTTAFLHKDSLLDTVLRPGQSRFRVGGSTGLDITIPKGGVKYRVSAYFEAPKTSGQGVFFALHCFTSTGTDLGFSNGTTLSLAGDGKWHHYEDDIIVPSGCAYVQDSPGVVLENMAAGAKVNMDEAVFAPYRAAQLIGAYDTPASAWQSDDTSSAIGPLQTDKIFFGLNTTLPSPWASTSNGCYNVEQQLGSTNYSQWPTCIIAFKFDNSGQVPSQSEIQSFLTGLPAQQEVVMVFWQEAEVPNSGWTGTAGQFVSDFETVSNNIRAAAAAAGVTPEVYVAQDSGSSQYYTGGDAYTCNWIVPSSYTDLYLVDHYERGWANKTNLGKQSGSTTGAQEWNNWLGCVKASGKPIGLAEYGLCSNGGDCSDTIYPHCDGDQETTTDTNTMTADNTYLGDEPTGNSPTFMWEYWYNECWQFNNKGGGEAKWRAIENQNGGAVNNN